MSKTITLSELKNKILEIDNVLIIAHINPDPDTLGSALGLKWILKKLNKNAHIICATEPSEKSCGFLGITPELDGIDPKTVPDNFDYIIAVDTASPGMLGRTFEKYNIDLVIDHHRTNNLFGQLTYLDPFAAATGEIIFDLAKELGIGFDIEFAKYIYCALVCDSGSFKFSSTTPKTLRIAADLIETGLDFSKLNRLIFENKSIEQLAVERLAYNSLKFCCGGRAGVINITRSVKKEAGLEGCEIEGISGIAKVVAGVEVGILIKETDGAKLENKNIREFKVSLRSNDYVDVAGIAAAFGGGGHTHAAGFKFTAEQSADNPDEDMIRQLLEKIESVLL
ncbi:MAG: bifunctional oligoribonuclease/PAP phosphatase NrnA [Oscillospiraceae bacterium]|nr:bifunctional oligoribonuclease/PAP phosphatase NrnA [Oscillospiraceae bacterium]